MVAVAAGQEAPWPASAASSASSAALTNPMIASAMLVNWAAVIVTLAPAVFRQYGFEVEVTENEQDPEYYRKMREADYSLEDIEAIDAEFDAALEEEE